MELGLADQVVLVSGAVRHRPGDRRALRRRGRPRRRDLALERSPRPAVVFLGSAANGNTTGEILRVTGGN